MKYTFTIYGTLPGLNEWNDATRANKYGGAEMKRQAEAVIAKYAKAKLHGLQIIKPVVIQYLWICPNKRRDKSNVAFAKKFVEDALVRAKVLRDDKWDLVVDFSDKFAIDKKNPRIEVTLIEVQDAENI